MVVLAAGVVVLVGSALWVGTRAIAAKDALQDAQRQLTTFRSSIGQEDAPGTAGLYARLHADTAEAARQVDDPVWSAYEGLPVVGADLRAFRQTAELVDALSVHGIGPLARAADGLSVQSLAPHDGRIDIAPLTRLAPAMADTDDALRTADASAARIDLDGVAAPIASPVRRLRQQIRQAEPVTAELRRVLPVLYPALGGAGTRHYLLLFQNNAEERSSGGNPASLAMLDVDDGRVTLGRQPNSRSFPEPYDDPILDIPGDDWARIYGDHVTRYLTNVTFTPDFPTTARLARAMWQREFGGRVDGVLSVDPVALSYLLKATGPVALADGTRLDSGDAVRYLLSDVYREHPSYVEQDAVFAAAAKGVFESLLSGDADPAALLRQVQPMVRQQRLKLWSVRADEEALLAGSPVGNMLPAGNADRTVLGVYNNDDATSKMSYYMDEAVTVVPDTCRAVPTWRVSATVTDTLDPSKADSLPAYVVAHQARVDPGGDRQWVQLYGPVGAHLVSASIDGKRVVWGDSWDPDLNTVADATGTPDRRPAVHGTLYGRPVAEVSINVDAGQHAVVAATFSGGTDPSRSVAVSHTPKVRDVPVTISPARCG